MASGEIPAVWGLGSGAESLGSSPGLRRIYFGACGGSRCSGAVGSRRSRGAVRQSSAEAAALGFVGRRLRMGEQGVRRGLLIGRRRPWRACPRLGSGVIPGVSSGGSCAAGEKNLQLGPRRQRL